jgi:hypothetical protein
VTLKRGGKRAHDVRLHWISGALQHGLVFRHGDVLARRLVVLEGFDGFGVTGLSCHGIPAYAFSA